MNRIRRARAMLSIGFGVMVRPRYWIVAVRVVDAATLPATADT
jgi:hypothetical protein